MLIKQYLPFEDKYASHLKDMIDQLQLTERVRWVESADNDNMPVEYSAADVVINYPYQDGFPVTLFEAAACKRRIVTSALPIYYEVYPRDCLWTARPKDYEDLAATIIRCIEEDSYSAKVRVDAAWHAVKMRGGQEACFSAFEALYQQILAMHNNKHPD